MKKRLFEICSAGIVVATVLAMAVGAGAQAPASGAPNTSTSAKAAPMPHHQHPVGSSDAKLEADMKVTCQTMMTNKQEMQAKLAAMDVTLDELVATMNAAKSSKTADAMEAPMAALLTELVAQRKASRTLMNESEAAMTAHMAKHMDMHGMAGAMGCPMMGKIATTKAGMTPKT